MCEAWWHPGILMGNNTVTSIGGFEYLLTHHDLIMEALQNSPKPKKDSPPVISAMEASVLIIKEVDKFFSMELGWVVDIYQPLTFLHSTQISSSLISMRMHSQ